MSDDLDAKIEAVERLAATVPPADHINDALKVMVGLLAEHNPPQFLHDLLHNSPSSVFVGLSTSSNAPVEVSGSGYTRQQYTGHDIRFPQAQDGWGTVEAIVLYAGNAALATIPLSPGGRVVMAGDSVQVDLHLTFT